MSWTDEDEINARALVANTAIAMGLLRGRRASADEVVEIVKVAVLAERERTAVEQRAVVVMEPTYVTVSPEALSGENFKIDDCALMVIVGYDGTILLRVDLDGTVRTVAPEISKAGLEAMSSGVEAAVESDASPDETP